MSLAIKYETVEDARLRLRHTVVLYKGQPVYINEVKHGAGGQDDIIRVCIRELPLKGVGYPDEVRKPEAGRAIANAFAENKEERKYISSKHFDIAPFKLGYVNRPDKTGAFFCSRLPNRVQKQGLCAENFTAVDNFKTPVTFSVFLSCKETPAMVAGEYPSFDKAVKLLAKTTAIAFDREFCLVKDNVIPNLVYLYHKGVKVGWLNNDQVSLGDKYRCLKEHLTEMRIKAA